MYLKEKVVLITGANRGIGHAILEKFIIHGAKVIGTATSEIGVKDINNYVGKRGKGFLLNLKNLTSIKYVIKNIYAEFGDINILINNAGIIRDNLLIKMKDDEWNDIIDINLSSVFHLSKLVLKNMLKKHYGRIINIGSVASNIGSVGQTNYTAAKAGLVGLSKSLAREVASRGITVNVVSPGFIKTDMTCSLTNEQYAKILASIPIGRFGDPKDVANTVLFLASDEAGYITGETLHVNGGMYMI